jgi:hypothetical protein
MQTCLLLLLHLLENDNKENKSGNKIHAGEEKF